MFGLFKKRQKPFHKLSISEAIEVCRNKDAKDLNLLIWHGEKLKFQVVMANHFVERGIELINENDMVIIHNCYKSKIKEFDPELLEILNSEPYIQYEDKGVFFFLLPVGNNPAEIQKAIQETIPLYKIDPKEIKIDYTGAKN